MRYHIKSCLFQFTGFDSNILEFHMIYLRIRHRFFYHLWCGIGKGAMMNNK